MVSQTLTVECVDGTTSLAAPAQHSPVVACRLVSLHGLPCEYELVTVIKAQGLGTAGRQGQGQGRQQGQGHRSHGSRYYQAGTAKAGTKGTMQVLRVLCRR